MDGETSNFVILKPKEPQLFRLGALPSEKNEHSPFGLFIFLRGYRLLAESVAEASIRLKSEGFLLMEDSKTPVTGSARKVREGGWRDARGKPTAFYQRATSRSGQMGFGAS